MRASGVCCCRCCLTQPRLPARLLYASRAVRTCAGDELYISYGDKSNEELLLLYGFAEEANPNDFLMLALPLPPVGEWDDVMHARMQLLQVGGAAHVCMWAWGKGGPCI